MEGEEPQGGDILDWLSRERFEEEFGFPEVKEEKPVRPEEKKPEKREPSPTTRPLRERIMAYEKELMEPEPIKPEAVSRPERYDMKARAITEEVFRSEWEPLVMKTASDHMSVTWASRSGQYDNTLLFDTESLFSFFHPPENLRKLIVAREILGPPRAIQKYRWRRF